MPCRYKSEVSLWGQMSGQSAFVTFGKILFLPDGNLLRRPFACGVQTNVWYRTVYVRYLAL